MKNILLASLMLAGLNGFAAEQTPADASKSSVKVEDAAGKVNKVEGNIDEEITNARMRAESGSKSKLSLSSSLSYTGGSFSRPFGQVRPNLVGLPGQQVRTSGNIGIDGRYRWSKSQSVTVGTSFGLMTPFQGDVDKNRRQLNVFDPSIAYNLVGKVGELQTTGALSATIGTSNEAKSVDQDGTLTLSLNALKAFQNGITFGVAVDTTYYQYNTKPGQIKDAGARADAFGYYGNDQRQQWTLGVYPYAEYSFNDRYSARTVFGYFNWTHLYGDSNRYRLLQQYVYQSVGVGISVTRDIYLYPNVQFVPDNIRSDFTNVAMSATLNVF